MSDNKSILGLLGKGKVAEAVQPPTVAPSGNPLKDVLAKTASPLANKPAVSPLKAALGQAKKTGTISLLAGAPVSVSNPTNKAKASNSGETVATDAALAPDVVAVSPVLSTAPVKPSAISATEFQHESQPDGLSAEAVEQFRSNLTLLAENLENKELVGKMLANLMNGLKEDPRFADILLPEDCGLMVRAVRNSYGAQIVIKQEKKTKKTKSAQAANEVMDALKGLTFDL